MSEVPEFVSRLRKNVNSIYKFINKSTADKYRNKADSSDDRYIKLMYTFWNILKDDAVCEMPKERTNKICRSAATSYHIVVKEPLTKLSIPSHIQKYVVNTSSDIKTSWSKKLSYKQNSSHSKVLGSLIEEHGYFQQREFETLTELSKIQEKVQEQKKKLNQYDQLYIGDNPNPYSNNNIIVCTEQQKKVQQRVGGDNRKSNPKKLLHDNVSYTSNETDYFDVQCKQRLDELSQTKSEIQKQIDTLKLSDRRCSIAEKSYRKDIIDSLERQKELLIHLQDVEKSASKWRKTKVLLKSQLNDISKRQQELTRKINIKTDEIKCMHNEIEDFHNRIDMSEKDAIDILNTHGNNKTKVIEPRKRWGDAVICKLKSPEDSSLCSSQDPPDRIDPPDSKVESTSCMSSARDEFVKFLYSDETESRSFNDNTSTCETMSNIYDFSNVGTEVVAHIRSTLCKSPTFTKMMKASQCFQGAAV